MNARFPLFFLISISNNGPVNFFTYIIYIFSSIVRLHSLLYNPLNFLGVRCAYSLQLQLCSMKKTKPKPQNAILSDRRHSSLCIPNSFIAHLLVCFPVSFNNNRNPSGVLTEVTSNLWIILRIDVLKILSLPDHKCRIFSLDLPQFVSFRS